jgi:hypothetical protein
MYKNPFFSIIVTRDLYIPRGLNRRGPSAVARSFEHFNSPYYYYSCYNFFRKRRRTPESPHFLFFQLNIGGLLNYDSVPVKKRT